MKLGLVDVGGGLRGIYAAGILDFCIEQKIIFDLCIGVSAGSANILAYLAGQKGRNYKYYCEYALRKEYMSIGNFLKKDSYIDLEYVYGTLSNSNGEYPLDFPALCQNPAEFYVVAQEAVTGKTKYFRREDIKQDDYRILMASSCIPAINRPYEINGIAYYDGALGDPIPIQKAFAEGCDKVVLILTRLVDIPREPGKDPWLARRIRKKYPKSAENLLRRTKKYNETVALAKQFEAAGDLLIVSPDSILGLKTLSRDPKQLDGLYQKGYRDGQKIKNWLFQLEIE